MPSLSLVSSRMSTETFPPGSVYLMAFERMFMKIWLSLSWSAYRYSFSMRLMRKLKSMFFSFTIGWERFTRFDVVSTMENVTGLRLSFPLSTLEMSSMSFIRVSRWLLARLTLRRHSPTASASPRFFSAIVVSPIMAFIGVRMSWLIVERKSVFALFATSAASFASSAALALSCSL